MEFRQLQYVVQIAIDKNFSRAAEKLHIAQPSLSQQLAKLEKEIGLLLFQRNTNSVELTHAGNVFVAKAQHVLDMIEQIKKEMDDISQMRKGRLIIGSLPITGSHILPLVLPVFQSKYPEIEIILIEETSANLEVLTAKGQADISLLSIPIEEKSLMYKTVIEEKIRLALPPQHPLVKTNTKDENRSVALYTLKNENFIIHKQGQGFRQITLELCHKAGFTPTIVFESNNIETIQSLVAAGMGIALVPEMVTRTKWSHFVPEYLDLMECPTRTLVIAYRHDRYLSKAAEAFIDTLNHVLH